MDQKFMMTLLDRKTKKLKTYDIRTGEVVSTDGVLNQKAQMGYSLEIADAICNLVREGKTLSFIADLDQMPQLHVIYKWREIHPDFGKRLKQARADRADFYHDKAEHAVERVEDKDDVPVGKFKFDAYMKLAEKGNPSQYGQQRSIEGPGALQIIVNTGIVRDDPVTVEVIDEESKSSGREQQLVVETSRGRGEDFETIRGTKASKESDKEESQEESE